MAIRKDDFGIYNTADSGMSMKKSSPGGVCSRTNPADCPAPETDADGQRDETGRPAGITTPAEEIERYAKNHRPDKTTGKANRRIKRQRGTAFLRRRFSEQTGS